VVTFTNSEKMEDDSNETLQVQNRRYDEESTTARHLLSGNSLDLNEGILPWIFNHIDYFVSKSQGNKQVKQVRLLPHAFNNCDHEAWDKVGQAIGNLQALKTLRIARSENYHDEGASSDEDDDEVVPPVPILDWEILAWILRHVRQNVRVEIDDARLRTIEEVQPLAQAICGHPTITSFQDIGLFPYESLGTLFSTLTTLPALESVSFGAPEVSQADESTLAHPESLTELLRVPTLRYVQFYDFYFTPALFRASANALMEGTVVTKLEFMDCSFSAVECDLMMANSLSRNTSVISIITDHCNNTRALFDVLAAALPSNSTLRYLELGRQDDDDPDCLSPVFSALGQNTGLKSLKVDCSDSMNESLCTAIKNGLGMNEALESLELSGVHVTDDNADSWCTAFSFLHTNKTLESLVATLDGDETESCVSTLRSDIACILQDNTSLGSLSIQRRSIKITEECISIRGWSIEIKAEEFIAFVTGLQHNTTLRILSLYHITGSLQLTDEEDKQMAALLKKNYALESFPNINLKNRASDVSAILRLNEAGRRYLIQDGSSISKGVEVLSDVNDDLKCVFLHLLENPRLCDRGAVEVASDSNGNGGPSRPVNHIEKREHGRTQNEGKESRRRLT
jgi:hypothetical protein